MAPADPGNGPARRIRRPDCSGDGAGRWRRRRVGPVVVSRRGPRVTRRRVAGAQDSSGAYCPHCQLLVRTEVDGSWPRRPERSPHCRLLIGAGRSRGEPADEPGARGTAAGVFAQEAKQSAVGAAASTPEVLEAIRTVAAQLGTRPERLLMVDYQQHSAVDGALPPLSAVFAAYGSWKHARREAGASV